MKKTKRMLAVLLTMTMVCGFAAIGAFAEEEIVPVAINFEAADLTEDQTRALRYYLKTGVPVAVLEFALGRVPRWLKWAAFSGDSSFEDIQAELKAELQKEDIDYDALMQWIRKGKRAENTAELLAGVKVIAEKGPAILKKHCVFYIDWTLDIIVWFNGLSIAKPLPA